MTTTTFADPDDSLEALEYKGNRLAENLAGLQKHAAFLQSEIASHNTDFAAAADHLTHLPADADAAAVFSAKTACISIEYNTGSLEEQLADLQPELAELPKLIKANAAAKKALAL
jgi:chromosome segregation ATPase